MFVVNVELSLFDLTLPTGHCLVGSSVNLKAAFAAAAVFEACGGASSEGDNKTSRDCVRPRGLDFRCCLMNGDEHDDRRRWYRRLTSIDDRRCSSSSTPSSSSLVPLDLPENAVVDLSTPSSRSLFISWSPSRKADGSGGDGGGGAISFRRRMLRVATSSTPRPNSFDMMLLPTCRSVSVLRCHNK